MGLGSTASEVGLWSPTSGMWLGSHVSELGLLIEGGQEMKMGFEKQWFQMFIRKRVYVSSESFRGQDSSYYSSDFCWEFSIESRLLISIILKK
ncbi:hypothetical protein QVD17_17135 [Tagetes erecta]|uniref:Uncharacterized protein n=1 Tax=Tagetes erecta TaxID=13708 RepID=A0AAD8KVC7_TARER|nr:hypothetical protein QVD17_17135 [Tagetes erecta]